MTHSVHENLNQPHYILALSANWRQVGQFHFSELNLREVRKLFYA
jgi:hypothetical protein